MENILWIHICFGWSLLLIRVVVVLDHFVQVFIHTIEEVFTIAERQSNKLVSMPFTHVFTFFSDCVGFLFCVVHFNENHEEIIQIISIWDFGFGIVVGIDGGRTVEDNQANIFTVIYLQLRNLLEDSEKVIRGEGARKIIGKKLIAFVLEELDKLISLQRWVMFHCDFQLVFLLLLVHW